MFRKYVVSIHAPTRGATSLTSSCHREKKVSIHAPTRGATKLPIRREPTGQVSIHAPTRGATLAAAMPLVCRWVSIHAPTRGATCRGFRPCLMAMFQSTHPHGVRPRAIAQGKETAGFNPRTHTGCDIFQATDCFLSLVSIHAPTRGATGLSHLVLYRISVSIHAPTRGATQGQRTQRCIHTVSIHAPTRGATLLPYTFLH